MDALSRHWRAFVRGSLVDVLASESIAYLRQVLARNILGMGLRDLDAAAMQMTVPRSLAQLVSRQAYESDASGVRYLSKYGSEIANFALFEGRLSLEAPAERKIKSDDDLERALQVHNLVLGAPIDPHGFFVKTVRGELTS